MSKAKGGFKELVKVERALEIFLAEVRDLHFESEEVPLEQALGRVLAVELVSEVDIPPFDRAAMDGYAVIAEDTFGASQTNPTILEVAGQLKTGEVATVTLNRGEAVAVSTGAMVPTGADAVVMVEYTEPVGDRQIKVVAAATPGDNVAKVGEVVRKGQTVMKKGTKLNPYDIGLLSSFGYTNVKVLKRPMVAVLSTGDELVEPGEHLGKGMIYDSNRPMIKAMLRELGCEIHDLGIASDDESAVSSKMREGLEKADLVIASAGSSVGERDLLPTVVESMGKPGVLVHGVTLRPGAPTALAVVNNKPVVLLPGYPVSSAVSFHCFVRPLLLKILGTAGDPVPKVKAKMARRAAAGEGLRTFLRVKLTRTEEGLLAEPFRAFGAGILTTLTWADGVVIIPEWKEGVEKGEEVEVILFRPVGDRS